MKTKYQIFISSTYEDLVEERGEAIKAVLEMGQIPVGMEMFSAGDEQQWELIKRTIDDCDYYAVIIAHRYGSKNGGVSYTEKEYDYAVSLGVPVLAFIINDSASWPMRKIEAESGAQEKLGLFKDKLKKKIVSFWSGREDLHGKVSVAISKAITAYPRAGWVRATEGVGADVTAELTRLSRENAELRKRIDRSEQQKVQDQADELKKLSLLLRLNPVKVSLFFKGARDWTEGEQATLFRIFRSLAPDLMVECSIKDAASKLAFAICQSGREQDLRGEWPLPRNTFQEWFADFQALGLIAPSDRKHHVKDSNEYWSITEKGRDLYAMIRVAALQKRATLPQATNKPLDETSPAVTEYTAVTSAPVADDVQPSTLGEEAPL